MELPRVVTLETKYIRRYEDYGKIPSFYLYKTLQEVFSGTPIEKTTLDIIIGKYHRRRFPMEISLCLLKIKVSLRCRARGM